jgi:hypothetical protein
MGCLWGELMEGGLARPRASVVGEAIGATLVVLLLVLVLPPVGEPPTSADGSRSATGPSGSSLTTESPGRPAIAPAPGVEARGDDAVPEARAEGASVVDFVNGSSGTTGWVNGSVSRDPPGRQDAGMAYDPALGGVVLFGGYGINGGLNDTWLFSNGSWTELCSGTSAVPTCAASPPASKTTELTYDPALRAIVLFGSASWSGSTGNRTWLFQNRSWSELPRGAGPPSSAAGWYSGVAYDPTTGSLLVYVAGVTWSFANRTWQRVASQSNGPAEYGWNDPMFYDPTLGQPVLLEPGQAMWAWNGTSWNVEGSGDEVAQWRFASGAFFDPGLGVAVAYGVSTGWGGWQNTTWALSDGNWTNVTATWGRILSGGTWVGNNIPVANYDPTAGCAVLEDAAFNETNGWTTSNTSTTWLLRTPLSVNLTVPVARLDVGQNFSYTIQVSGGPNPPVFEVFGPTGACAPPSAISFPLTVRCAPALATAYRFQLQVTGVAGEEVSLIGPVVVISGRLGLSWKIEPNPATVGVPVTFAAIVTGGTAPISYFWQVGETAGGGAVPSFDQTFAWAGTYPVTVAVRDALGESLALWGNVTAYPGISLAAVANVTTTDVGIPVGFNASSTGGTGATRYAWAFGDGSVGGTSVDSHTFGRAGRYAVVVWANDSVGGGSKAYLSLLVNPAISAEVFPTATQVEQLSPVELQAGVSGGTAPYSSNWTFPGGEVASGPTATTRFEALGLASVELRVHDAVGASANATVTLMVVPSPAGLNGTTALGSYRPAPPIGGTALAIALAGLLFLAVSPQMRRRLRRRWRARGAQGAALGFHGLTLPPPRSASSRSTSPGEREKSKIRAFSSIRSRWTDFGISISRCSIPQRSRTWAGVRPCDVAIARTTGSSNCRPRVSGAHASRRIPRRSQ